MSKNLCAEFEKNIYFNFYIKKINKIALKEYEACADYKKNPQPLIRNNVENSKETRD